MIRVLWFTGLFSVILMGCTKAPSGSGAVSKPMSGEVTEVVNGKPVGSLSSADLIDQSKAMLRADAQGQSEQRLLDADSSQVKLTNMFDSQSESSRISVGASPILKFKEDPLDIPAVDGASVDISIKID